MKKSIVVSTSLTKFSALAFKENLKESIKKVAELGFDGAELAIRNPKDLKVDDVINIIKDNNLEVPAIGTGQAYGEEGLSFSDPDGAIRRMTVERIKDQIIFASHFDAQVIIGLIRGIINENVDKNRSRRMDYWLFEKMYRICKKIQYRAYFRTGK